MVNIKIKKWEYYELISQVCDSKQINISKYDNIFEKIYISFKVQI
jgi:hypothetical protein